MNRCTRVSLTLAPLLLTIAPERAIAQGDGTNNQAAQLELIELRVQTMLEQELDERDRVLRDKIANLPMDT